MEWKGGISDIFWFLVSVKFSEYKETELPVVRVTRYLGFRVQIPAWDEESFLRLWKNGEERGLEQSRICSALVGGHLWGQGDIEFFL